MLVVRVGSLTSNVVTQLDKVPGELVKTANDQCNVPPLKAARLHFSVRRVAGSLAPKSLAFTAGCALPVLQPKCFVALVSSVRRGADSRQES
jgi:hypothetical protein